MRDRPTQEELETENMNLRLDLENKQQTIVNLSAIVATSLLVNVVAIVIIFMMVLAL